MAQVVKLKRSAVAGNVPESGDMVAGELAMNTADGKLFLRDETTVRPILTTDNEITGSINLIGNITASGDISGSGNLYANLSSNSSNYNTVVYNNSTGQFFYTGSYGGDGGSSLTVGGTVGAIQYSDGAGALDFNNNFIIEDSNNATRLGPAIRFKTDTNTSAFVDDISNNLSLRYRGLTFSTIQNFTGSFANFEGKKGHLMLYPQTEIYGATLNNLEYLENSQLIASSRFHVVDDKKQHTAKIINLDNNIYGGEGGGAAALLIGTRNSGCQSQVAAPFTFVDFQVGCGVHQGQSIGGIYYDPCGTQFASNGNGVVYQGFVYQGSDKKLKKHITDTKRGIDDIMSMKVKDYRWKGNSRTSTKSIGLIAQDLQETHPELVTTLNDTLNVNYTGIVPMLIKAIQDQQEQIDDLKKQLENK